MTDIKEIYQETGTVVFDDGTSINHEGFLEKFRDFLKYRIAGETLVPGDMERFMRRTSAKNLKLLLDGKKMEGYLEGSMDKMLTPGQKLAIGVVVTMIFVGLIVFVVLNQQGVFGGNGV